MCGIVGVVGGADAAGFVYRGLELLEYRGYDSAGIVTRDTGRDVLLRERVAGRVGRLRGRLSGLTGDTGIGHTRWATHGRPSVENAHPLISRDTVAVAHNGIIENHEALRHELEGQGYRFESETDTEVVAHLMERHLRDGGDTLDAMRACAGRLEGAFALVVIVRAGEPGLLCARKGSPLLLGVGDGRHFVSSDARPICERTDRVVHLENGDVAELSAGGFRVVGEDGAPARREVHRYDRSSIAVNLGSYRHFMEKEIYEQPEAVSATIKHCVDADRLPADIFGEGSDKALAEAPGVTVVACGTSLHAAMVARHWVERLSGVPCNVEIASEHRYRESPCDGHLLVSVSQSGETADTLAAVRGAMARGARAHLAITNVATSTLAGLGDLSFLTHAGPEIGVASTKAFTAQLAGLRIFALALGRARGRVDAETEREGIAGLRHLPFAIGKCLALDGPVREWAKRVAQRSAVFFVGRNLHHPVALEGALKLKEISYIHAEGHAGGELKHGPLALVDRNMPVVGLAPDNPLLPKMSANLSEIAAREGMLLVLAGKGFSPSVSVSGLIRVEDDVCEDLSPVVYSVLVQLLAYYTAREKGTDIDKPRNLAKSVTVE